MNQCIKIGNEIIECINVGTTLGSLIFAFPFGSADEVAEQFRNVNALSVVDHDDNDKVVGVYENLHLNNVRLDSDGSVTVTMDINTDIETRLDNLEQMFEQRQEVQDGAIADLGEAVSALMEGGDE